MNLSSKIGIAFACILFFASCNKENNAPIIPAIESLEFRRTNGDALWIIGFTDGDGDIGVKKDNENPDNEVLNLTIYGRVNGTFQSDTSYGYSIDYIENVNPHRPLEGKLEVEITGLDFIEFKYPAFYYEAYLEDRAGHHSNTIQSPIVEF